MNSDDQQKCFFCDEIAKTGDLKITSTLEQSMKVHHAAKKLADAKTLRKWADGVLITLLHIEVL